jgi:branched-chain amino acid transport system substrate-binding protein
MCDNTRMKNRLAGLLVLFSLLLTLNSSAVAQPAPLEIDVMLSLTGPASFLGKAELDAFQVLEKMVNQKGGVNGRPLKLVYSDDTSSAQVALQLANSYIAKKDPVFVGSPLASACASFLAIVAKSGPVDYCLSPPVRPPSGGYVFVAGASAVDLSTAMIRYFKERGYTRFGVLTTTDATGHDFEDSYLTVMGRPENKSLTIIANEHFNTSDISVTAQLARIKAGNPQVLLIGTVGTSTGTILRGVQDIGLDVPVGGPNGNMLYQQMANFATILPKELIFPSYRAMSEGDVRRGPIRDAQNDFFKALKSANLRPDAASVTGWDPMLIVLSAYKKLGSNPSAQQIKDYISNLHGFAGVNGIYDFRDGGQRGIGAHAIVVDRWDAKTNSFVVLSKPGGGIK